MQERVPSLLVRGARGVRQGTKCLGEECKVYQAGYQASWAGVQGVSERIRSVLGRAWECVSQEGKL